MSKNLYPAPELGVPIPFGYSEEDKLLYGGSRYVCKFYEAPDFVRLHVDQEWSEGQYEIAWATDLGAFGVANALDDFIRDARFATGRICAFADELESPVEPGSTIIIGGNIKESEGSAEETVRVVRSGEEPDLYFYELHNDKLSLAWTPSYPVDFHDIPTHEIRMRVWRSGVLGRQALNQCIEVTAMPSLEADIHKTLDEFAEYESGLAER